MQEEGKEVERRPVFSRQFSRVGSSRPQEVPVDGGGDQMTLAMAFATEKIELSQLPPAAVVPSRTLSDVIKDEDDPRRLAPGGGHRGVSWKAFKDRLKLRRSNAAWSASSPSTGYGVAVAPGSPRPLSILEGSSALLIPNFTGTIQRTSQTPEVAAGGTEAEAEGDKVSEQSSLEQADGPMKVSLMALLEQQERSGPSFAAAVMGLVKDEDEEGEEVEEHGEKATTSEGKEMLVCCVCMVRHKGAAFIPCGHTFCRLCSRELWASRGNCPLCNGYIREILDIF